MVRLELVEVQIVGFAEGSPGKVVELQVGHWGAQAVAHSRGLFDSQTPKIPGLVLVVAVVDLGERTVEPLVVEGIVLGSLRPEVAVLGEGIGRPVVDLGKEVRTVVDLA